MRTVFLSIVVLSLASGCGTPRSVPLDERWRPLERVVEDGTVRPGHARTLVPIVYVQDVGEFLRVDRVQQDAILLHEQVHALRQVTYPLGVGEWVALYRSSAGFRWQEEQAGWRVQIGWLVRNGQPFDWTRIVRELANGYPGLDGEQMVDYLVAADWVEKTVAEFGR